MEVYVIDANGENPINLTNSFTEDTSPAWSPDGAKIAFTESMYVTLKRPDDEIKITILEAEIFVMNADGTNQINLTHNIFEMEAFPSWSPDGTKIALWVKDVDGNYQIRLMNVNGTVRVDLTDNPAGVYDQCPAWSPFLQ